MDTLAPPDSMDTMTGLYELFYATLSGDSALQALLGGTPTDTKVYPVTDLGRASLPAVGMSITAGSADVGRPIERPLLDLTISSKVSATEVVGIADRIATLLNRVRLAGNGRIVHLSLKQYEHDDFVPEALEFTRNARYALIAQ
jgi:hypothetical protein